MARVLSLALLFIVFAACGVWGALALWYHAPLGTGTAARVAPPAVWTATVLMAFAQGVANGFRKPILNIAILMTGLIMWWSTIRPSNDRDWAPEVARITTGKIDGSTLTLSDARNFAWRTTTDFEPVWEARTYDLDKVSSVDLIASYWAGETIAHILLSFGFEDGRYLVWSTEVRKKKGQHFSTTAGFFKQSELGIVAGDERDLLRLRTTVRDPNEDVRIYRMNVPKDKMRELLVEYVARANALKTTPEWYNTATTNCTTVVFHLGQIVAGGMPFDWRVLATGYFPNYAYDRGALTPGVPFDVLRERGKVTAKAKAVDSLPQPRYSQAIREDVPGVNGKIAPAAAAPAGATPASAPASVAPASTAPAAKHRP